MTATIAEIKIAAVDLERARVVARKFATDVRLHFGARLKAVRLYGSAARGDWSTESDIDVLVLLDRVESADAETPAASRANKTTPDMCEAILRHPFAVSLRTLVCFTAYPPSHKCAQSILLRTEPKSNCILS